MPGSVPHVVAMALSAALGLAMGPLLVSVAECAVRGERWPAGRPRCEACGHELACDLVLGWLSTGGRRRSCGERIPARYPATGALMAGVYVALVWHYGLTVEALEMMAFSSVLLVLSLTDIDDYVIPNGCIVAALAVRALYLGYLGMLGVDAVSLAFSLALGMAAVMMPLVALVYVMDHVLNRPSMGFGDLKLYAVACLYFGWQRMLFLIIVSCVLGLASAVAWNLADGPGETPEDVAEGGFPFGPAIAVACVITALFGDAVLSWYLSFIF